MTVVINGTSGITDVNGTAAAPAITGTDTDTGVFFGTNTVSLSTGGTESMRLDSSGNLGLGVTPSAWASAYKIFEMPNGVSLGSYSAGATPITYLNTNVYDNGTNYIYKVTGYASRYIQSSGQHAWYNAASGSAGGTITFTQAMTLDASGNLGLGVTSPSSIFDVKKNDTTGPTIALASSSATSYINQWGSAGGGSGRTNRFEINAASTLMSLAGGSAITFQVGGAGDSNEKARIDSSGNLLVGRTSGVASEKFSVLQSASDWCGQFVNSYSGTYYGIRVNSSSTQNNTSALLYDGLDGGNLRFRVYANGGIANYTANDSPLSDRRLKKNITPAGSYLEKICAIPVVTYLYNDQTDDLPNLGVIAQDVQAAAPELCNEEGWGTKAEDGTNYLGIWETDIQYALMKCIQEQQAIITQLQADVAALKGQA